MKYKVGDRVRIKSLDWYKEQDGLIPSWLCPCCGRVMTITVAYIQGYAVEEVQGVLFKDFMIEGLVKEETKFGTASNPIEPKSNANHLTQKRVDELATKIDKELPSGNQNVWELSDGYQFVDENGNVINATKIVLEKKKKEYPKTYEECCELLGKTKAYQSVSGYKTELLEDFQKLLICRDAYWKIAGDEMGLGEPWEPDWKNNLQHKHYISTECDEIKTNFNCTTNKVLAFPTEEMRGQFYENFKELIEQCKELL